MITDKCCIGIPVFPLFFTTKSPKGDLLILQFLGPPLGGIGGKNPEDLVCKLFIPESFHRIPGCSFPALQTYRDHGN